MKMFRDVPTVGDLYPVEYAALAWLVLEDEKEEAKKMGAKQVARMFG